MARRRKPQREIAFSFDSFLDVVANVVGIILKLILVAWVGARSYKATMETPNRPPPPPLVAPAPLPEPTDARTPLLARKKKELGAHQKSLVGQLAQRDRMRSQAEQLRRDVKALAAKCRQAEEEASGVAKEAAKQAKGVHAVGLGEKELIERTAHLRAEADKLRRLPSPRKEFRYRTPVSVTLQTHEIMFECKSGRVTLIDTAALVAMMRRDSKAEAEKLRTRWTVSPTTSAAGPFRLRYTLERERSVLAGPPGGNPVDGGFRFSRTRWEVEPISGERGEPADGALAAGSEFRKVIDALDAKKTAVTLWVYPDSFPLYRKLRDYLHDRDIVVAGRPLPEGVPIASSVGGTNSRGQ